MDELKDKINKVMDFYFSDADYVLGLWKAGDVDFEYLSKKIERIADLLMVLKTLHGEKVSDCLERFNLLRKRAGIDIDSCLY